MGEKCPLTTAEWGAHIPQMCRTTCEELIESAVRSQRPELDTFTNQCGEPTPTSECRHEIESEDVLLQRSVDRSSPRRFYGILNICSRTETELFSETYTFECPKN